MARLVLFALSASLAFARPAAAQDAIALDSLDLQANMATISVVATFVGDANADASAFVEWRASGAPSFTRGHALVRLSGNRFAGAVLWCSPGSAYDVRVVALDPDNGAAATLAASVTTRADAPAPQPASGATFFVDVATGSDANPGSAASPFATIQRGADAASPGDVVRVRPGVYREHVLPPRGGNPGAPVAFVADGPGAVIDGSDPSIDAGPPWTAAGAGLYWTPFAGETIYVAVDDVRVYDYQALTDLQQENGNIGVAGCISGGFFVDAAAQRLYLMTPDHSDPSGHRVHVAVEDSAFLLDTVTDVVIEGFEMRYFGAAAARGGEGVDIRDSARCWIRANTIHHVNCGVRVRRALASGNVIENNRFRDTSVYSWPWTSVKAHTPEASAVSITHGHGNVVRWNDLEGSFNGIYTGAFGDGDEEIARDTDVYENVLRFHGDDGLEFEGAQRNVRAWENVVQDVFNAVSLAPIEVGPVFLVRNVLSGYTEHALKINNGTWGWVFIYHATAVPASDTLRPDCQAFAPSIPFGGITMRNNIWEANRYVVEYGDTTLAGPVDFDFDDLWTSDTEGLGRFVKWLNVRHPDLASLAASMTIERRGFQVRPQYEAAATGDFTLLAGHPLLDVGEVLPGINDAFIVGAGPDVGAFERGGVRPGRDPVALPDILRSDVVAELPARPDARFVGVTLPWTDPDAVLTNGALAPLLFYLLDAAAPDIGVPKTPASIAITAR